MPNEAALRELLARLDGRSYKAYRELRGAWMVGPVTVDVDHVQGDPFASPSRLRIALPLDETRIPADLHGSQVRRTALEDWWARRVAAGIGRAIRGRRGSGGGGRVTIDAGQQAVLERTAARVAANRVEARLGVGLPAAGRRILGRDAEALLCDELPALAMAAFVCDDAAVAQARAHVEDAENHAALQTQLAAEGLVAFVADGALLPRASGADDRPLREGGVTWRTPASLRASLELPHPEGASISGMGIPEGVTLVVGGGYHGKSTLLHALERAVHPHIAGDGRERVATARSATKIRAEDGRRVVGTDISGFVAELPGGRSTRAFESDDASGSTSQAANIAEALEAGARVLLLDEDTSATNFMVRDARMQALVHPDAEPITPFVDRVRELWEHHGVSTVLVMGGSGDYFDVADTVIEMRAFVPHDVTGEARRIAQERPTGRRNEARTHKLALPSRVPLAASLDPAKGRRDVKIEVRGTHELGFGATRVDLRAVEQLIDPSQVRALGWAWAFAARHLMGPGVTLGQVLDALEECFDTDGLEHVAPAGTDLARPRRHELAAALNRLRTLRLEAGPN